MSHTSLRRHPIAVHQGITRFRLTLPRVILARKEVRLGHKGVLPTWRGVLVGKKGVRLTCTGVWPSHKGVLLTCRGVLPSKTPFLLGRKGVRLSCKGVLVGRKEVWPSRTPLESACTACRPAGIPWQFLAKSRQGGSACCFTPSASFATVSQAPYSASTRLRGKTFPANQSRL